MNGNGILSEVEYVDARGRSYWLVEHHGWARKEQTSTIRRTWYRAYGDHRVEGLGYTDVNDLTVVRIPYDPTTTT